MTHELVHHMSHLQGRRAGIVVAHLVRPRISSHREGIISDGSIGEYLSARDFIHQADEKALKITLNDSLDY